MKEVLLDTDTVSFYFNLQVVTNNQAHFQRIEGLELDNWA